MLQAPRSHAPPRLHGRRRQKQVLLGKGREQDAVSLGMHTMVIFHVWYGFPRRAWEPELKPPLCVLGGSARVHGYCSSFPRSA